MYVTGAGPGGDELPLQQLYRWEQERPSALFLTQPLGGGKVRHWSWAQAAGDIRHIAGYLKEQNWPPGSQVAILSRNCAWWMMADLAIWMAGHVTVPIYPSLRASTVRQILEHSDSKACFIGATDELEEAVAAIPAGLIPIRFPTAPGGRGPEWDTLISCGTPIACNPVCAADRIATIFYTSGTTGAPKGVVHRFVGFSALSRALAVRLGLSSEQRVLSYLPLAHILERGGLELPAILFGWHVFFAEGPATFLADLRRARPTLFYAVPRVLLKLQQGVFEKIPRERLARLLSIPIAGRVIRKRLLHRLGLDSVRHAFSGGAPLSPEVLLWYRNLGLNLMEGYGLTEAMITHLPEPGQVRPGFVGRPLEGVEALRAENGELLLRSSMNMLGYYKDLPGTHSAFTEDGFLRTGDIVEIDGGGDLKIIGRLKEQFKTSKGKYVTPAPIETKLMAHPDVESCCLMGTGLPGPFAVVVLSPDATRRCLDPVMKKALEESLCQRLEQVNAEVEPHEKVGFVAIAEGPWTVANGMVTPTLKLKRAALESRYLAWADAWQAKKQRVVWQEADTKALPSGGEEAA